MIRFLRADVAQLLEGRAREIQQLLLFGPGKSAELHGHGVLGQGFEAELPLEARLIGELLRQFGAGREALVALETGEIQVKSCRSTEQLPVVEPEAARQQVGAEVDCVAVRARQHLFANLARRQLVDGPHAGILQRRDSAAKRRAHPDLALRRHLHFEWKQHTAGGEVRACVAAPVDKAHEQVSVRKNGIQRREQPPGRIAIERWSVLDFGFDLPECTLELVAIGSSIQVRRHLVKRALQFREIRPQLGGRERGRRATREREAAAGYEHDARGDDKQALELHGAISAQAVRFSY